MLSSHELHTLYEGLRLNSMNQYDYVLTGKAPGHPPPSRATCAAQTSGHPGDHHAPVAVLSPLRRRPSRASRLGHPGVPAPAAGGDRRGVGKGSGVKHPAARRVGAVHTRAAGREEAPVVHARGRSVADVRARHREAQKGALRTPGPGFFPYLRRSASFGKCPWPPVTTVVGGQGRRSQARPPWRPHTPSTPLCSPVAKAGDGGF